MKKVVMLFAFLGLALPMMAQSFEEQEQIQREHDLVRAHQIQEREAAKMRTNSNPAAAAKDIVPVPQPPSCAPVSEEGLKKFNQFCQDVAVDMKKECAERQAAAQEGAPTPKITINAPEGLTVPAGPQGAQNIIPVPQAPSVAKQKEAASQVSEEKVADFKKFCQEVGTKLKEDRNARSATK